MVQNRNHGYLIISNLKELFIDAMNQSILITDQFVANWHKAQYHILSIHVHNSCGFN